jgi:CBS domain-containing protein
MTSVSSTANNSTDDATATDATINGTGNATANVDGNESSTCIGDEADTDADADHGTRAIDAHLQATASIFSTHYDYPTHVHQFADRSSKANSHSYAHESNECTTATNINTAKHRFDESRTSDDTSPAHVRKHSQGGTTIVNSRFTLSDEIDSPVVNEYQQQQLHFPPKSISHDFTTNRGKSASSPATFQRDVHDHDSYDDYMAQRRFDEQNAMLKQKFQTFEISEEHNNLLLWLIRASVDSLRVRSSAHGHYSVGNVVTAYLHDTLHDVARKMIEEQFLSCPVIDNDDLYRGVIDLLDIIWRIVSICRSSDFHYDHNNDGQHDIEQKIRNNNATDVDQYKQQQERQEKQLSDLRDEFASSTVEQTLESVDWSTTVRGSNHLKGVLPITSGFSIMYVLEAFSRRGVHRMPIIDQRHIVTGLVTQSMCINLFALNLDFLGSTRYTTVEGIVEALHPKKPFTVLHSDTALSAFGHMVSKRVNGLAVVDSDGYIVDALSVRDIRGIGLELEHFHALYSTVSEFKKLSRAFQAANNTSQAQREADVSKFYVTYEDTLETLLTRMSSGNLLHRVWVVASEDTPIPIHVISQRDVIRFILFRCGMPVTSEECG